MIKIFTVVGTRPNILKIDPSLKQDIIWTGQHHSFEMGMQFFRELDLPKPKYNLGCKSSETGRMIDKLQKIFKKEQPNMVIVFGDTNSSLAGTLAAAYCNIKIAHIEAGMRSYRRDMPEEINRIVIDHLATINFCVNANAQLNLLKEGIKDDVFVVGDVAFDSLSRVMPCKRLKDYGKYLLLTLHRNFNADNKNFLEEVLSAIEESGEKTIFPVHPRTAKNLKQFKIKMPKNVKIMKPKNYKEFVCLLSNAKKVLTDSGGVQREAFWMQIPVIILRTETEWLEILTQGGGMLATSKKEILRGIQEFKNKTVSPPNFGANKKIKELLYKYA